MVELSRHLIDSYGGTQWTVTVELSGQLRWNSVDSCGGTQ